MRTGFEVVTITGETEFYLFPQPSNEASLVTYAQDPSTGTAAVLIGRIYYQDELKARLFNQNFSSDAALVLAIFQNCGAKALEWLEGEFALVVYDSEKRCLLAMRDPLGNWPLYWVYNSHAVRIGTNLRSLAQQLPQAAINRDFLATFLMFPYAGVELATEQTAFEQIQRILPGTIVSLHSDGRATQIWSWDWMQQIQTVEEIAPQEAGLQFMQIFRQAVKERTQFGKIASHLSGGMDSSSVVCVARDLLATGSRQLTTLSLVYQLASLAGEKNYIQMAIDQGGAIDPHYINGDRALDFQWFATQIPEHDEPYAGLFHLAMEKALMDAAAQLGITTILSGGGAEIVAEGNRFHLADLVRQGRWQIALQEARQWSHTQNISLWSVLHQFAIAPLLPALLHEGIDTILRRGYGRWPKLGLFTIPPWILPDFARDRNMWNKALATVSQLKQYPVEQSFNQLGLKSAAGDWAAWYLGAPLGIRICQPFLDPRLITYCLGLPTKLRVIPGVQKPLLHVAMRGVLPEHIRNRQYKVSFNEVYWTGLARNLPDLEDMVKRSRINDLGIFDKQQLIQAMRQHAIGIGDASSGSRINSALAAIAWFDRTEKALQHTVRLPNKKFTQQID